MPPGEEFPPGVTPPYSRSEFHRVLNAHKPQIEVHIDPSRYPVTARRRTGRVIVTFALPIPFSAVQVTVTTDSPIGLEQLAFSHRCLLGAMVTEQCLKAFECLGLNPSLGPRRQTPAAEMKWVASEYAKEFHPTLKYLYRYQDAQDERFRVLVAAVEQDLGLDPAPRDLTAWVIEHLWGSWDAYGLRRPTTDTGRFAKEYLYTKPHMVECTPETFPERIRALHTALDTMNVHKKIFRPD